MHIYESHMGGIFASSEPIPFEELYCEQCGDSDHEIGYVDDDDPEAAWELLTPNDLVCIGCMDIVNDENDSDEECDDACVNCTKVSSCGIGGMYDLCYVMHFIEEVFQVDRRQRVYVILTNEDGAVYVQDAKEDDFFKKQVLLSCFCLKEDLASKIALSLIPAGYADPRKLKRIDTVTRNGATCYIFKYESDHRDYIEKAEHPDAAWHCGDDWVAWFKPEEISLAHTQEWLTPYLPAGSGT